MFIDSHAHLNMKEFKDDLQAVIERATLARVGEMLNVGYDPASIEETLALTDEYPGVYAAVGIHPHHATDYDGYLEERIRQLLLKRKVLAVGEMGLDYYRDLSPRDIQKDVFRRQIRLALNAGKPIVVHCRDSSPEPPRDAFPDTLRILGEEDAARVGGIFHAFSGGPEEAEQVISMGFLIGIGGPLTYRTSRLPEVAERLPSSSFVLETDCPYLPPQQYRGRRNEPSYIPLIAESLARIRGVSIGDIERAAEANFRGLMHGRSSVSASVAYWLKNSIYINVTASCTNDCSFCTRFRSNNYLYGYNLNLDHEPSAAEMVSAALEMIAAGRQTVSGGRRDAAGACDSIVFCGYGEPTARLKAVKEAAGELKKTGLPLRLNTNGHGSIINGRNIVPELEESFSSVSISLNAPDAATYMEICRPDLGAKAFPAVVDFIKAVAASRMECIVTALDYPDVDLVATRRLVESIPGASFRVRKYHYPGVAG